MSEQLDTATPDTTTEAHGVLDLGGAEDSDPWSHDPPPGAVAGVWARRDTGVNGLVTGAIPAVPARPSRTRGGVPRFGRAAPLPWSGTAAPGPAEGACPLGSGAASAPPHPVAHPCGTCSPYVVEPGAYADVQPVPGAGGTCSP